MILNDGYLLAVVVSSLIYLVLFVYCCFIRKNAGIVYLMILVAMLSLQGMLSVGELLTGGLEAKLIWRNLQQIPLYSSSVMLLGIIMFYIRIDARIRNRSLLALTAVIAVYWILMFTDNQHHLIRRDIWVEPYSHYERIGLTRSPLGDLFAWFPLLLALWGVVLLVNHYRKVIGSQRNQLILLIAASLCPYLLPQLTELAGGRINVSTAVLPTAVIFFYSLHLYKFLQVRPLAREKVLEHMSEAILIADERNRIIDANPAARMVAGLNPEGRLIGASLEDLFTDLPELKAMCESCDQSRLETEVAGKWFEVRFIPLRVQEERTGSLLIFADITERKLAERELIRRATTDGLTGLSNRQHFFDKLHEAREACRSEGKPISLIVIDLDHFKSINDRYGHTAGDELLCRFAAMLREAAGDGGTAGRIGGEEFAVFCPGANGETSFRLAERIRQRAVREPLRLAASGESVAYSVSIGVAELHDADTDVESLYAAADDRLYASKQSGRNRTTLAMRKL